MVASSPLLDALRARHEPHRSDSERVQAYLAGLREQNTHKLKEVGAGALFGAALGGSLLGRPVKSFADRKVRGAMAAALEGPLGEVQNAAHHFTPDDVGFLRDRGFLSPDVLARDAKAVRLANILKHDPVNSAELVDLLGRVTSRDFAAAAPLDRGALGIVGSKSFAGAQIDAHMNPSSSAALKRWLKMGARSRILRYVPHILGAGLVADMTQNKYKDLKKTPEEVAAKLRQRDLRRYMVIDGVQDMLFPSMAVGSLGGRISGVSDQHGPALQARLDRIRGS